MEKERKKGNGERRRVDIKLKEGIRKEIKLQKRVDGQEGRTRQ
jgi:hypothetical protein